MDIIATLLSQLLFTQSPEWVYQYFNPDFYEVPYAITVDDNNNSYITGYIGLIADGGIGIIKLDTYGSEKWVYWTDPLNSGGYGCDIAYKNNQLYVTGYVQSATEMRCVTICIDTARSEQWLSIDTMAHGRGAAIALDSAGGVYTAGMIYGQATDIRVIKYDTLGNVCWRYIYDGPASSYDNASDIVADRWNNVYVGGYSTGITTYSDYTIIKLDSAGNEKWVYRYDGPNHARDEVDAIAVDPLGNTYLTGGSSGSGWDICVVKVDSGGSERWVYRYNGLAGGMDYGYDLALDDSAYIYIAGVSKDDSLNLFTVIKLDSAGNERWVYKNDGRCHRGAGASQVEVFDGMVYAGGSNRNEEQLSQIATVCLNTEGDTVWTYVYNHNPVSPYSDVTRGLVVDRLGNVYQTGTIHVSQWDDDIVVLKFRAGIAVAENRRDLFVGRPMFRSVQRGGLVIMSPSGGELRVCDIAGRTLIRRQLSADRRYQYPLPAGVYFVILEEGGETVQQKLIVVK